MALDFNALKAKLNTFTKQSDRSESLWKPTEGKTTIRIVPWAKNRDNPFIELYFHYIGNKTYISPLSFGRRDPIAEFADKLVEDARREGRDAEKAAWKQANTFRPKLRTYVPIIVRGEEDKGVRFFSFGKTVYQDLLSYIADPDYGDITDPKIGRDVAVEYIPQEKSDTSFAKTSVKVKPNQTPVVSDIDLAKKLLNEQPDIFALYKEPTYEELMVVLQRYLDPEETTPMPAPAKGNSEVKSVTADVLDVKTEISESAQVKNALDEFDKLFDN
jgi:hypothetical protein